MPRFLSSRAQCKDCGWRGVTRADRAAAWIRGGYILAALAAVVLEGFGVIDLRRYLTWPVVIAILVGLWLARALPRRLRACRACGRGNLETPAGD